MNQLGILVITRSSLPRYSECSAAQVFLFKRVHRQSIMFIMFITSCHVHHSDMI